MSISVKTKNLIWGEFAGRCAICKEIVIHKNKSGNKSLYGEIAHIIGEKEGSARYIKELSVSEKNSESNLILLCANHHTIIDKKENEKEYSVEKLHSIKNKSIEWIRNSLKINKRIINIYYHFYMNLPRLLEIATTHGETFNLTYYVKGQPLYQQPFEFINVMASVRETLNKIYLDNIPFSKIFYPNNNLLNNLIYFENIKFRTKNIFQKNYEVNRYYVGNLNKDPHIYFKHENGWKLVLRIDTQWIPTQTALGSFSPPGGVATFSGVFKVTDIDYENNIMYGSPLVVGLPPSPMDLLLREDVSNREYIFD
ncbi:MAG: HNH endonuclease [Campylobacteraceae bacterium]|nr:HNH endonuclease [Campylobacteraceae bacterium]